MVRVGFSEKVALGPRFEEIKREPHRYLGAKLQAERIAGEKAQGKNASGTFKLGKEARWLRQSHAASFIKLRWSPVCSSHCYPSQALPFLTCINTLVF